MTAPVVAGAFIAGLILWILWWRTPMGLAGMGGWQQGPMGFGMMRDSEHAALGETARTGTVTNGDEYDASTYLSEFRTWKTANLDTAGATWQPDADPFPCSPSSRLATRSQTARSPSPSTQTAPRRRVDLPGRRTECGRRGGRDLGRAADLRTLSTRPANFIPGCAPRAS